jgi:hypothetical protein
MTPEQRVGKTANLVIFLGILYTILSLVALAGNARLAARGFGGFGLAVALAVIGLGYGIRYGYTLCLSAGMGIFALLDSVLLFNIATRPTPLHMARFLLSAWTFYALCRTVPALRRLKQSGAKPVRTSPYGDLFLRRWRQ